MAYIERRISNALGQAAREYPVVTITGPRQSGKTTLVRHQFPDYAYVNLESPDDRRFAMEDPRSFLKRYAPPVVFDEIQRAPQLLSYIQVEADEHPQETGRYILTGSQQMDLRAAVSQSLAGRTALLRLLPFSIAELRDAGIILDRDEYLYKGFMPRLYEAELQVTSLYRNYYQTYVERDVRQFAAIRNIVAFETFLRLLAGRVGQVASMSDLANSTGVSSTTLAEWLGILEASFIVFRLPPYYKNFGKRLIKSPKLYFIVSFRQGCVKNYFLAVMIGYHLKKEDNRWISSSAPAQDQALKKFSSDLSDGARGGSVARPFRLLYGKTRCIFAPITLFAKFPAPCDWTTMS